jgi:hypothetical protein
MASGEPPSSRSSSQLSIGLIALSKSVQHGDELARFKVRIWQVGDHDTVLPCFPSFSSASHSFSHPTWLLVTSWDIA